jgi:hypothetical protein
MPLRLRWTHDLAAPLFSAPLVGPGVTAPGTFALDGLDLDTGAPRWRVGAGHAPRSFAWAVQSARGPVACAGANQQWRITGLDPAGQERFTAGLEGWGCEAAALAERTYVLFTREGGHSGLWELDGDGVLARRWQVPAGGCGLSASGRQVVFVVRSADDAGLYQVDLDGGGLRRLVTGRVDRATCHEDLILAQAPGGAVTLRDRAGGALWETAQGGLTPRLASDGVYGAEPEGEAWTAVCRDLWTGALRWRHPLPEGSRYLDVLPWEDLVVLWDGGPLTLVDRRTGAALQTIDGEFTAVGPDGFGDGVLAVAAGEQLRCYERG